MMALLAAMVARRVSCSTLPLWRPLSLGPLTHSPFAGASSRALFVSAHSMHHMLAFPLTLASNSGARSQPQSIASSSSTQAPRFFLRGTPTFGSPFSSSVAHDRLMHLFFPLHRRSYSLIPWCFGTLLIVLPTVVVLLWTSFTLRPLSQLASLSTRGRIAVHLRLCCPLLSSDHMLCSCRLNIPQAPLTPFSAHSPLPRVHDWSTVVAACHHSLSTWHQSSGLLPDFLVRASVLDSLFDSFTRILCGCASHHFRRPKSRPRTRQPLWWNDACYHALVARNGSWRDFRRSGSLEDQARFRLLRQQFHSTVPSSRTRCRGTSGLVL